MGGDMSEVVEKKEGLQKKIQEKIAERTTLRDEFAAEKRKFQEYLAAQRRAKQERYQEEQKARQAEWKLRQLERKVEALDDQPHVAEMTLIEQTIKFCKDLMPQETEEKKDEKKDTAHNNTDKETVLLSKESRNEEIYFAPTKKEKAAKKKAKAAGSSKTIKHNVETFKLFDSLKLDAPITTADIPPLLEKLDAQMKDYEAKVKAWQENKEAMKAKILAGEVDLDEEEAKEEEKPAEKEEEK